MSTRPLAPMIRIPMGRTWMTLLSGRRMSNAGAIYSFIPSSLTAMSISSKLTSFSASASSSQLRILARSFPRSAIHSSRADSTFSARSLPFFLSARSFSRSSWFSSIAAPSSRDRPRARIAAAPPPDNPVPIYWTRGQPGCTERSAGGRSRAGSRRRSGSTPRSQTDGTAGFAPRPCSWRRRSASRAPVWTSPAESTCFAGSFRGCLQ